MRVHAGKLEDASKPRAGRHRRATASPQSPLDASDALPESDPALDLPFPAPPGLFQVQSHFSHWVSRSASSVYFVVCLFELIAFQICQPDTHPDLVPSVAEEVPLNFLEDVDEAFLKQALPGCALLHFAVIILDFFGLFFSGATNAVAARSDGHWRHCRSNGSTCMVQPCLLV